MKTPIDDHSARTVRDLRVAVAEHPPRTCPPLRPYEYLYSWYGAWILVLFVPPADEKKRHLRPNKVLYLFRQRVVQVQAVPVVSSARLPRR